jgi:hypothetical protein
LALRPDVHAFTITGIAALAIDLDWGWIGYRERYLSRGPIGVSNLGKGTIRVWCSEKRGGVLRRGSMRGWHSEK